MTTELDVYIVLSDRKWKSPMEIRDELYSGLKRYFMGTGPVLVHLQRMQRIGDVEDREREIAPERMKVGRAPEIEYRLTDVGLRVYHNKTRGAQTDILPELA